MTPDSRNVLWKRSWDDEHLQRICGFANAQGGVLEIGKDDVASPGVGLNDLDGRAVDRFRRRAVECERAPPEVLDESVEGIVENLHLRRGAHLKRTAALLFHPSPHRLVPGAYVKIGCFRGPDLLFGDVVRGDLFTQADVTMDLLYTKYTRGLRCMKYDDGG